MHLAESRRRSHCSVAWLGLRFCQGHTGTRNGPGINTVSLNLLTQQLNLQTSSGDLSCFLQQAAETTHASPYFDHQGVVWPLEAGVSTPTDEVSVSVSALALASTCALETRELGSVAVGRIEELKELIR